MGDGRDQCANPTWCNLMFVDVAKDLIHLENARVHGLPQIGATFDHHATSNLGEDLELWGVVKWIRYATTTDGSFKPTVGIEVRDPEEVIHE